MNIGELSKTLDVPENTLRTWEKDFSIKVKRESRNRRKYNPDVIAVFERIKKLKTKKRTNNSIRLIIKDNLSESTESLREDTKSVPESTESLREIVRVEVSEALINNNELSEKYSRATYKIGELETTNKFLLQENEKLKEDIKLLPAPNEYEHLKKENDRLKKENQELKEPWWKRLFK